MVASFRKMVSNLKFFTSPVHAYGRGKGRMHIFYCEMFIIGRNLTFFFCVALIFHAADDTVFEFRFRVWSVRNDATSNNWVLPIIKCPPVQTRHWTDNSYNQFPVFAKVLRFLPDIQSGKQIFFTSPNKNLPDQIKRANLVGKKQTNNSFIIILLYCIKNNTH